MTSIFSIRGELRRNVRSTPTPCVIRRTVKFRFTPPPRRRITTPSNGCKRSRFPSTTFTCRRTVSPDLISGIPLRNWAFSTANNNARPAGLVTTCLSAISYISYARFAQPMIQEWKRSLQRENLSCVEPLHQARFTASSVVSMNYTFFGGAIQFAHSSAYSGFSICINGNGLASFSYLRFNEGFNAAIMQAALLLLAHTFFSSCIIGHVSTNPPRIICPFTRADLQKMPTVRRIECPWIIAETYLLCQTFSVHDHRRSPRNLRV